MDRLNEIADKKFKKEIEDSPNFAAAIKRASEIGIEGVIYETFCGAYILGLQDAARSFDRFFLNKEN